MPQPEGSPLIDFGIITAVKTEREAVRRAFNLFPQRVKSRQYWRGQIELGDGAFYEIVLAQSLSMAGINAALVTSETVQDWSPGALLLVGFAAAANDGTENDHERLGDLIIGSHVYYYTSGKETDDGVDIEPYMHSASADLFGIATTLPDWTSRIPVKRPDRTRERPRVITGVIASGERVIAAQAVREQIRKGHRKIRAIEMESYGFSQAAWEKLGVKHLVMKAICDRADREKDDEWQPYAAAVAAGFSKYFLLNQPLPPRNPPRIISEPPPERETGPDSETTADNWEARLPKIDFKKAFATVDTIFAKIQSGGCALFLLQKSSLKGGEWCVAHIRELLSKDSARFRPLKIGFEKHQAVSHLELLKRFGKHLNIKPPEDTQTYPDLIIERLRDSLQPGSTVLIELSLANDLSEQRDFLSSLVSDLWRPMVRMINDATDHVSTARIVFVISAEGRIHELSLDPALLCRRESFDQEKILGLPLTKWTRDEIKNWLVRFLPANLTNDEYSRMAASIFNSSDEGLPLAVYSSLLDYFTQTFSPMPEPQENYA
jgi:nucleoside phosphorylase